MRSRIEQHLSELTVTMIKVNPDPSPEPGEGTIWFDYFLVNDPTGHEGVAPRKTTSKGAIIGVTVGGFTLFALVILGAFLWMRRSRLPREEQMRSYRDCVDYAVNNKERCFRIQETHAKWNRRGDLRNVDSQSLCTFLFHFIPHFIELDFFISLRYSGC